MQCAWTFFASLKCSTAPTPSAARDGERWSFSAAGPAVPAGPGVPQLPPCHRAGVRPCGPRPADQRQPREAHGDRL